MFCRQEQSSQGNVVNALASGLESAWVLLTDLKPDEALVSWYGLRTWTLGGFKDFKRGLWGWHHSKMSHASSVERLWLAMAVAQLWRVSVGCQAEVRLEEDVQQSPPGSALPARHIACKRGKRSLSQLPPRRLSCVVRGKLELLALLFLSQPLPLGMLQAQVWPQTMTAPQKQTASVGAKKKTQKEKERRKRQKRRACKRARATA